MQIFYLQQDPTVWVNKSTGILDQANQAVRKAQDDSNVTLESLSFGRTY